MIHNDPFTIGDNLRKSTKLSGKYKHAWTEESFDIDNDETPKLGLSHTKGYLGIGISRHSSKFFLILVLIGITAILGRTFFLQVVQGSHYRQLAENNRVRIRPIPSERGIVYDRFGRELVQNVPSFSVAIIPQDLPTRLEERREVIDLLAGLSGITSEEVNALLDKYGSYSYESLVLKENLDYQTALQLYLENASLPGIFIESGTRRNYSAVNSTTSTATLSWSHVLGYLGKINDEELDSFQGKGYLLSDSIGKTGVEKSYEEHLRGTYGRKKIEIDALGHEQRVLTVEEPRPGKDIILTIDKEAQVELERLVRQAADKTKQKKIAAVALDPSTGGVLAIVSWPSYNNNDFAKGITSEVYKEYIEDSARPLFNRAVAGAYPSGSTIKPVMVAAALQENIVTKNTTINSVGGFHVGGTFFRDWLAGGHGQTNAIKAIAQSINTYFYYIGGGSGDFEGLGVDRIVRYLRSFNIGEKTGIDVPGENAGFVPSKEWKKETRGEIWYVGDTYNLSIGQGDLLVTPLQVAVWTAAIGNGGTIMQPHVVEKIVDPITKQEVSKNNTNTKKTLVSRNNIAVAREGMRACVEWGSCRLLTTLPFSSGGKTGTAQWSNTHPTHAWFTAFAPYENPRIVVTVLIEEGGEGGVVSTPVARDFLAWWGKKYLR